MKAVSWRTDEQRAKSREYGRRWRAKCKRAGACPFCGGVKPPTRSRCDECSEYWKSRNKEYAKRRRLAFLALYDSCCACCGETQLEFLSLEHVGGSGSADRKRGITTAMTMARVLKSGRSDAYQVLCHNCNQARGFYGRCPHEVPPT